MLTEAVFNKIKSSFDLLVDTLGVPAVWTQSKAPNQTQSLVVGFRTTSATDIEVINTYGFGTVIITLRAEDLPAEPQKFDTFLIHGETYVANASHQVNLNGSTIGYKLYSRRKQ